MDNLRNQTPAEHESLERAAKWDAIGRIAAIATLPALAFLGIILKLAWPQLEQTAPLLLYFFEVCIVVLVTGSIIGLFLHFHKMSALKAARYEHNTYRFSPDMTGNFDAVFDQAQKRFIQALPGNMQELVPQTYAPHLSYAYEYKDSSQRMLPEPQEQGMPFQANLAPTIEEVITTLPRNGLQLSLGRSLTSGELLQVELPDNHVKLLGASRKGKSSLAGGLLEQIQRTHDPNTLQFALLDLEYKTSRLFERSPHVAYVQAGRRGKVPAIARSAEEVAIWLKWMYQEMERRYKMTSQQLAGLPYILVYIEEFLDLRRRLKGSPAFSEAIDNFTSLATRGLKVRLSLMVCAQVDYSSEELRDAMAQFVGINCSFAVKPDAARAAGMISNDLLNKNYAAKIPGQYVVEATGFTDLGVSPQYDVRQKLQELDGMVTGAKPSANLLAPYIEMPEIESLAPSTHPLSTSNALEDLHQDAPASQAIPAWQAYYEQVLTLYEQGYRSEEVLVQKVFNRKKGGNKEWYGYRDIVRQCLAAIPESEVKSTD